MSDVEMGAGGAAFDEIGKMTVQGQALRYGWRFGQSKEPPLLICNGIGANLELLAPFVNALDDRPVITFDVPGVGGSPLPSLPYRLHHLAGLADRLMRRLGYTGRFDLLGISWGGALAQQFARDHPQRCRKLVLAATSAGVLMVPGRLSVLRKLASPRRYHDPAYLRRVAAELYGGALRRDASLVDRHIAHIEAPHGLGYVYQLGAIWGWTSLPWLHRLRQPTLVLAGTEDPIVPLINARILAHFMPRARLEAIDDGHLFVVTSAPAVAASVASFLTESVRDD